MRKSVERSIPSKRYVQNLLSTAQLEKPTHKGCEKASRTSLPPDFFATSRRLSTTGPTKLRHQVDRPSSRLPHRAFDYRANHAPGIAHSHRATTGSIARDCYRLVYRAYRGMVNAQYRVDHRASKRYNLIASKSLLSTGGTTTSTGNASPPPLQATPPSLSATRRRHRYRQSHDRDR